MKKKVAHSKSEYKRLKAQGADIAPPKNSKSTSKRTILAQMQESRPLPMGKNHYEEWSERIISGSLIPHEKEHEEAFQESQKFALASMLLHIGPTESHKPDAHFIHGLRVAAIKQTAHTMMMEIKEMRDKKEAAKILEELDKAKEELNDSE